MYFSKSHCYRGNEYDFHPSFNFIRSVGSSNVILPPCVHKGTWSRLLGAPRGMDLLLHIHWLCAHGKTTLGGDHRDITW